MTGAVKRSILHRLVFFAQMKRSLCQIIPVTDRQFLQNRFVRTGKNMEKLADIRCYIDNKP